MIASVLAFGCLPLIPVFLWAHPPLSQIGHDPVIPQLSEGGKLSQAMPLIIAIVGTTVAP